MMYRDADQLNLFEQDVKVSVYDTPVLSSFVVKKGVMLDVLRALWAYYKYRGKSKYFVHFELIVRPGRVIFSNYSSERYLQCAPYGFVKATFYYQDLLDAVRASKKQELLITVQDRIIAVNGFRLKAEVSDYDPSLDVARNTPTLEELSDKAVSVDPYAPDRKKNYFTKDGAKGFGFQQILKDTEMTEHYLKKYGISYWEIKSFIQSFLVNQKP